MIRWLKRIAVLAVVLVVVAFLSAWLLLRGSLATLEGEVALRGLSAPVSIQRDALGVVTIDAANETDALRALGYVHAQERYFEMDLMRRTAAGELAGLFGPVAVGVDKRHRVHRMRARVDANLDAIAGSNLPQLQAYTDGVNAGLAGLDIRPWPYLLLRQAPEPWLMSDSALAGYAMYFDLQDSTNARELALWKLRPHLPPALFELLTHEGTSWDAPLSGEAFGDAVLPSADDVDLRGLPAPKDDAIAKLAIALTPPSAPRRVPLSPAMRERGVGWSPAATDYFPGSNNFAVSGALTVDGRAIVADDMHLGLRAPNIWFRARLRYSDDRAPGGKVDVQGLTLPGLPAVIVGSNGHVAWGFTNSYGDYLDWALETPCRRTSAAAPGDPATEPCAEVETHVERIAVAGGDAIDLDVRETRWGPVLHDLPDDKLLSLRWTAHLRGSLNFGLAGFAVTRDLDDALSIADRTATPTQNLVIGDAKGRIAWRLLGPLPERAGGCSARHLVMGSGDEPRPPRQGEEDWRIHHVCQGWTIATDASPERESPTATRLWTANARVVSGEALELVGDGGYALGARQQQIRDQLLAKDRFTERDLLAIQLDDRALLMTRWWELLNERASRGPASPALRELSEASRDWQGHASIDSAGYRIVRAWRLAVHARILDGLVAPARAALGDDFETPDLPQFEGVAWPLVSERPAHLLSRRFASWDALFEDAAVEIRDELAQRGPLRERSWGERNTTRICHPLADAIPVVGKRALCMPAEPLPGDGMMPRVQGPSFGASQRMVVSPGHEADGILHMPGGQSGHPLSPFWGAGHDDWARGRAAPFLPGEPVRTLVMKPTLP